MDKCVLTSLTILVMTSFWCLAGGCLKGSQMRREAVSVGVAEYYLDESWQKQFRWKTNGVQQ